jgi:TonB family protein
VRTVGIGAAPEPRLDPDRAAASPIPEADAPPQRRQRGLPLGPLASLALHLLPLLFLVPWLNSALPVETPPAIPVQLVIEQPPPPPEPAASPDITKPPQGRLASEEVGAKPDEPSPEAVPQPSEPPPAAATPPSAPAPPPEPQRLANLVPPQSGPTLLDRDALALPSPSIEPLPQEAAAPAPPRRREAAPRSRPPQRTAAIEGPPAARDEYLAHLVTLVRPYLSLLSPGLLRGRRGTTSLAIRVLGDGTIARIAVAESSGYPDIDAKVIEMIAAVGRFPPLPPWIDQPSWDINFHLRFPFAQAGGERP